ncbi:MAG: hypothetical protein ACRD4L_14205 [Pyrinomonadaceae bacterium]
MPDSEVSFIPARERGAERSGESHKLLLLTGAALRGGGRWARQHLYELLFLTPIVIGMIYLTTGRLVDNFSDFSIPRAAQAPLIIPFTILFTLGIIILNLSSASRVLYHLRRPAAVAEPLPVAPSTHLNFALLMQFGRTSLFGGVLVGLWSLLHREESLTAEPLLMLGLFIALVAQAEVSTTLYWINWCGTKRQSIALCTLAILLTSGAMGGLLLTNFFNPAVLAGLSKGFGSTDAEESAVSLVQLIYVTTCLLTATLYWLTHRSHERWRATNMDYAQRLGGEGRRRIDIASIPGRYLIPRVLTPHMGAMLARDLRLTLRLFSSSVYAAGGVCLVLVLLLLFLLTGSVLPSSQAFIGGLQEAGWLSATWLPAVFTIKLACLFAVIAVSALLPVLVNYQLPHLWLERVAGVTGADLLQVKLWYTRLLTFPVMLLMYALGVAADRVGGGVPLSYVLPLLVECMWIWWVVSSFAGVIAFEVPDRTGLAVVLVVTIGLATGGFSAMLWVMGLAIYGMCMTAFRERGSLRARYYLMSGEE